ncbi:hypothetical protein A2U01_0098570, partial [Trifolium medium]|nr:hypothetical protein [Trifolium medium]
VVRLIAMSLPVTLVVWPASMDL